jgi:7-carboxy-7-deazaguanine synthase
MKNALIVSETFYSIQGEGQTVGTPAVFLRLGGCNLLCESSTWRCDTIEVWRKSRAVLFEEVLNFEQINALGMGAHLVITGGEPLLHQYSIVLFLNWFREMHKFTPIVEIETNGTIIPDKHLLDKVDYWNVSPKLPNSGMSFEARVNEAAISTIQTFGRNKIFKFVVFDNEDLFNIFDEYAMVKSENIILMPAGDSVTSLANVRIVVVELCKKYGFRFSDRLHISLWDKKTGV